MIKNDGDYITIITDNGIKKTAELINKFEIQGLGEYIIYKLDNAFYGAKYEFDGENTKLITDLTDNEKASLNEMFKQMGVE
ncbi:MAG: hypothetical protein IJI22_03995 [Bacilli bacterium]|nr:hypothetical protein [Bacilli bacterium]